MRFRVQTHPVVFGVSVVAILGFLVAGLVATSAMERAFSWIHDTIAATLGWYYVLLVGAFLVFVVVAGGQPLRPYPPRSRGQQAGLPLHDVVRDAVHRGDGDRPGVLGGGRYIVVGLSQAYLSYRHDLPLSIRSTFYPLLGKRIHGRIGDAVDIFAVFGTMFGVATSLGFGVLQVNAGLASLGLLPQSAAVQVVLIAAISATACLSVAAGLDKGMPDRHQPVRAPPPAPRARTAGRVGAALGGRRPVGSGVEALAGYHIHAGHGLIGAGSAPFGAPFRARCRPVV
ncbi:hypothetical protein GCM10009834_09220 [Streptomonospora arabica]